MNVIENDVQELVQKELNAANEKFPLFNSTHQGYAVIKEEVEECSDNITDIIDFLDDAWYWIKQNNKSFDQIRSIKETAIKAACEAIQVAAMCEKYNLSLADGQPGCCACGVIIPEGMQVCPKCRNTYRREKTDD